MCHRNDYHKKKFTIPVKGRNALAVEKRKKICTDAMGEK